MGAVNRVWLAQRIADERAEQLALRHAGRHADAERRTYAIDRLLDRWLQIGKPRAEVAGPRL